MGESTRDVGISDAVDMARSHWVCRSTKPDRLCMPDCSVVKPYAANSGRATSWDGARRPNDHLGSVTIGGPAFGVERCWAVRGLGLHPGT